MLTVEEKAVQSNTGLVEEDGKTTDEGAGNVETIVTAHDDDEALQHLERLRKQYGVSQNPHLSCPI